MTAPLAWSGGHLDGTPWQGIRFLSISVQPGADPPVVLTAHLNLPSGTLTPEQVVITGGRRLPPPPHTVEVRTDTVVVRFTTWGDHSLYTLALTDGGGSALHPFFAAAQFRFTIDCACGDCRDSGIEALTPAAQPPAVDLLTKDYNGFVALLSDWVKIADPGMGDLSSPAFERVLLELLAWAGDLTSYYQDRVAGEAFIETASQRFSLRQHAVLLGTRLDDGRSPTTVLALDPTTSGFVPAGLPVRMRTAPDELAVTFTVSDRTRVFAENASDRLKVAAFPGAVDAVLPAGARELLLFGHDAQLRAGDRLALVQGPFSQLVTLTQAPQRLLAAGWVADPGDTFDPASDPAAPVTRLQWTPALTRDLLPWADPPLALFTNLADARYGTPRRAVAFADPAAGQVALDLTPRTSIVARGSTGALLLRALRVPEWPVAQDDDGAGGAAPAVELTISGERWIRVQHLLASRSYDLHFTAEPDEDGAVWLRFGDGVNGHEVPMLSPQQPVGEIELRYRIGDPVTGNVGLGTLVEVVRPATGTDEQVTLDALGTLLVRNVVPATGGAAPASLDRIRQDLTASLHHGDLQRAVALEDYATVAMQVPGVGRATARATGGQFNTVTVLVDPAGGEELDDGLRTRISEYLDTVRMTGREHLVLAAEYVPLEVVLDVCAQTGYVANLVRDRVLAELRPGSDLRPGWFHPDRLSFGDAVRLGDLLAFVQGIPGVRTVKAEVFRPLGDTSGPPVRSIVTLGRTKVARLDADPDFPEHGTLDVRVVGLDVDASAFVVDAGAVLLDAGGQP